MNEAADMLENVVNRLFADYVGHTDSDITDPEAQGSLWASIEAMELPLALVPECHGGSGLSFTEIVPVLRAIGRHAVPTPLVETMIGALLLADSGLTVPPGIMSIAPIHNNEKLLLTPTDEGWRLEGTTTRVPWARLATTLVIVAEADRNVYVARIDAARCTILQGANVADEPRDDVIFDIVLLPSEVARLPEPGSPTANPLPLLGAAARCAQISGTLDDIVTLSAVYAQNRVQFGRPIATFQAVQHLLAELAGHAAVAASAADLAAEAIDLGADRLDVAIAKASAGRAAGEGAAIAHQVHGAIGITRDYRLHRSTLRLMSWRDEFGGEAFWQAEIGRAAVATGGGSALWARLTR